MSPDFCSSCRYLFLAINIHLRLHKRTYYTSASSPLIILTVTHQTVCAATRFLTSPLTSAFPTFQLNCKRKQIHSSWLQQAVCKYARKNQQVSSSTYAQFPGIGLSNGESTRIILFYLSVGLIIYFPGDPLPLYAAIIIIISSGGGGGGRHCKWLTDCQDDYRETS